MPYKDPAIAKVKVRARAEFLIARGLCPSHPTEPLLPEKKRCFKCKQKYLRMYGDVEKRVVILVNNRRWHENNLLRHRELNRLRYQQTKVQKHQRRMLRLHTNPQARLAHMLRSRFWTALRAVKTCRKASAVRDLGCTIAELRQHLEVQFKPGMTWENHGTWHIDHIRPLASFDLVDPEQQRLACHYTNLQPLWAEENLSKGSSYAG